MPVIINEILIRSNVENAANQNISQPANGQPNLLAEEIVKQAVEKVLEILEEKKHR
jgi:hypothetical protein